MQFSEIEFDEFKTYLNDNNSYFINRLGGSDIAAYFSRYRNNNNPNIEEIIKLLSICNGYYDISKHQNNRKENLELFFNKLMSIYQNNLINSNACNAVNYINSVNPTIMPNIKYNNQKYICYHHQIETIYHFIKNILQIY